MYCEWTDYGRGVELVDSVNQAELEEQQTPCNTESFETNSDNNSETLQIDDNTGQYLGM